MLDYDAEEVTAYLHEHIPITRAMQLEVMPPEPDRLRLLARHQLIDRGLDFVRDELSAARHIRRNSKLPEPFTDGLEQVEHRLQRDCWRLARTSARRQEGDEQRERQ